MIPRILKVRLKKFEKIFMLIVFGRNFRRAKTVFVHLYLILAFCLIEYIIPSKMFILIFYSIYSLICLILCMLLQMNARIQLSLLVVTAVVCATYGELLHVYITQLHLHKQMS